MEAIDDMVIYICNDKTYANVILKTLDELVPLLKAWAASHNICLKSYYLNGGSCEIYTIDKGCTANLLEILCAQTEAKAVLHACETIFMSINQDIHS